MFGSCFTEVCFADPEGLESLTSSPQAFYVAGELTVTAVQALDLALVLDLHYTS
jgi:hypothetical protein